MDVTVAIATWNRARLLRKTLESLTQVKVPDGLSWHLVVCDNNSTDDTERVVQAFRERLPVRHVFEPQQGKSHALNHLLQEARADSTWIIFTDDDVLVDPNWLVEYFAAFQQYPDAACFGGPMHPWIEGRLSKTQAFLVDEYPGVFALLPVAKDTAMQSPDHLAYGANMALRLDAVAEEGFDIDLGPKAGGRVDGEDVGMIRAIMDAGHSGWMLAGPKVKHYIHPSRLGLRYFIKWHMFIGRAAAHNRGAPTPGKFGVPWWAWREFARRFRVALLRWRPWATREYYDAVIQAAWYMGYLRHKEEPATGAGSQRA